MLKFKIKTVYLHTCDWCHYCTTAMSLVATFVSGKTIGAYELQCRVRRGDYVGIHWQDTK